jgi:hypothetical protein
MTSNNIPIAPPQVMMPMAMVGMAMPAQMGVIMQKMVEVESKGI